MSDANDAIRFRPLAPEDLRILHGWLQDPAVVAWWEGRDVSWDGVQRDYADAPLPWLHFWLALRGDEPIGWIQHYCAADAIDGETWYWQPYLDLTTTAGIDYLVAPEARGAGTGTALLRAFVAFLFGRDPAFERIAAGPFEANQPSVRALEKAGFRRVARLEDADGPCALMAIERAGLER